MLDFLRKVFGVTIPTELRLSDRPHNWRKCECERCKDMRLRWAQSSHNASFCTCERCKELRAFQARQMANAIQKEQKE